MRQTSSGAIVQHEDGTILVLHYINGHWDFVKGKIDPGETELQTLHRETQEETGITDLEVVDGFRKKISYWFHEKGKDINKTVIYRLAKTKTKEVTISDEHQGYKWLPYDEALEILTYENAKSVLRDSKEFLI